MGDDGVAEGARRAAGWARRAGELLTVAVWTGVAVSGLAVVVWTLRVGESTDAGWAMAAMLPQVLVAAWPVAIVAAILRRWSLVIASAALIVAQLVIAWPVLGTGGPPKATADAARFTVGSVNLFVDNPDVDAAASDVVEAQVDVLAVQELTPAMAAALDRAGVGDRYPYRREQAAEGTTGVGIYSRWPLVADPDGGPDGQVGVLVEVPDADPVWVVDVHVFAPQPGDPGSWGRDLRSLDRSLDRVRGPWVAIGDYNATVSHRRFRDLLDHGRHDAHLQTGRGLARTWPAGRAIPPLALIDHAVLSPDLVATSTAERTVAGTDHRMIVVDLATSS